MCNLAGMKKANAIYFFILILFLSSCNSRFTERNANGFGGGNWNVKNSTAVNVPHKIQDAPKQNLESLDVKVEQLDTVAKNGFTMALMEKNLASGANRNSKFFASESDNLRQKVDLKSKPKWKDIKQVLRIKKELKKLNKRNSLVPDSSSSVPQWIFFCVALLAFLAGIFIMFIPDTMGWNIVFGVLSWLVGGFYLLGVSLEEIAQDKGTIYKIGFYATFFMPLSIFAFAYPLFPIFILMWIIGAIFDI